MFISLYLWAILIAAQAYKIFSDRKTPSEVIVTLNLRELEATKF
jgi:hypothetical protein